MAYLSEPGYITVIVLKQNIGTSSETSSVLAAGYDPGEIDNFILNYIHELDNKIRKEWQGSSEEVIKDYLPNFSWNDASEEYVSSNGDTSIAPISTVWVGDALKLVF